MHHVRPTARQLAFHDWEFGLFLHFGLRTFHEGHRDWDQKPMAPAAFAPSQLDCNQWITTAKLAGMRYAVMTVKHHDGFLNWPSKHGTDFSVAAAPWKEGKGDVVAEFVAACRRQSFGTGLYYSPADWHNPDFKTNAKAYDEYFLGHLRELLTNYGKIDIIWFDGCGSTEHPYDWDRISSLIRELQPDILIGIFGDPDYRWVGNESGLAPMPCWNVVSGTEHGTAATAAARRGKRWLPAECDCRLRDANWFYSDQDEHTIKPVEEVMGLYYYSVGRGANLLLNVGPDRRGMLPDTDAKRLVEVGAELRRRFGRPFGKLPEWKKTETGWAYESQAAVLVDHVIVQEDLAQGEHVRRFAIELAPGMTVYEGHHLGHKAICRFPLVSTRRVALQVLEAEGPVTLRSIELHNSAGPK